MKRLSSLLAFLMIASVALSLFATTTVKAAPATNVTSVTGTALLTKLCTTEANTQICYDPQAPQYTDPTYSCPAGSEPIEGDPTHCLVTTTDTVYADRPQVPATYKCPDGYTQYGTKCRKQLTEGYWDVIDRPITTPGDYVCPGPFTFSASRYTCPGGYNLVGTVCKKNGHPDVPATLETFSTGSFNYDKSNDPNKCHLPTGVKNEVPSWAMADFNAQYPEWLDSTYVPPVYGSCPEGYAVAPDTTKCQKWIPPTYDETDMIVDVPAHPGDCPEGYEVYSDTQCSKQVTQNETIDATVTAGTPYCDEGVDLVNGMCMVIVPCPPVETVTICYQGETIQVPVDSLGQYDGYTEGACEQTKPTCEVGFLSCDEEGCSCKKPNYDFCHSLQNVSCQRHWRKLGAFGDFLDLLIFKIRTGLGL